MKVSDESTLPKEEETNNEEKLKTRSKTFSYTNVSSKGKNLGEVYCISCFINKVWNNGISLKSKKTSALSITNLYEEKLYFENCEYIAIVHKITLFEESDNLKLQFFYSKDNNWNLNKIKLNLEDEKIIFDDLEINLQDLSKFLTFYDSIVNKNNNDDNFCIIDKISRILKPAEKLRIYLNYFRNQENIDKDLKLNLVKQFFSNIKKNNKVDFSLIIEIFNLCFETELITNFIDTYPKLNYQFDDKIENKKFNDILNLYKNNREDFLEKNKRFIIEKIKNNKKNKIIIEKYNLLENFIIIYQLFYESQKQKTLKKETLLEVEPTLISLINNKDNIISYMKFILYKFEPIYTVINSTIKKIEVKTDLIEKEFFQFEDFKSIYLLLVKEQEEKGFILNFGKVFNYFLDNYKGYDNFIEYKKIYIKELKVFPNDYFKEKINKEINNFGLDLIIKGDYINDKFLIYFIINNEFYNKKNKDFSILNYFKIELMDDTFFQIFNKEKVYAFFENDLEKYISIFCDKIKDVKYFGHLFKLLPPEKYNKKTIIIVFEWLRNNFNTFTKEKCPNFINEIKIMIDIMTGIKLIHKINELILFLKDNIGEYSKEIFIFLLNSIEKKYAEENIENIIKYLLNPNEQDKIDDICKNVFIFLERVKVDKTMVKIILSKFEKLAIKYEDFFKEKSLKFDLFEKLLNNGNFSLFSNDVNRNEIYWGNTLNECTNLAENLKCQNITYIEAKFHFNIIGKETLLRRTELIFKCIEEDQYKIISNKVISEIEDAIEKANSNLKMIEELKIYNNLIGYEKGEPNDELSEYNKKILKSNLQEINSQEYSDEFEKYRKDIEKARNVLKLKESILFLSIFNNVKNSYVGQGMVEITLKKFEIFKNLFVNDEKKIEKELRSNSEIKHLVNIGYQSIDKLIKEIDWLLAYFKIYDYKYKDFLIEKINYFVENKSLYSKISGIINIFDIYKEIVKKNNINNNEEKFYNELNKNKNNLYTYENISNDEIPLINEIINKNLEIDDENKNDYSNFFIKINQYPDSLNFIKDKESEKVKNLMEFLLESDDIVLTEKDINDFIKVVRFFEELFKNNQLNNSFCKFVNEIIKGIQDNNVCGQSFYNYIEKNISIQELFDKYLKGTEGCIKKIKNILKESDFNMTLKESKKYYEIKGFYTSNLDKKLKKYILYEDLELLFQRISISKLSINDNSCITFIKFFKNVKELINICDILYTKGYHKIFDISIKFRNSEITCLYNNNEFKLENLFKLIYDINIKVIKILKDFYKNNEILRLFYGRQLYLIYKNLYIQKEEKKNINLFKVISNNNILDIISKNNEFSLENSSDFEEYKIILGKISDYFKTQLKLNGKNLEDIYKFNKIIEKKKIENNNKFEGIYFKISNNSQEIESLSYYNYLTNNLPINSCFLYCSKDISSEEITCFVLRSIFCELNIFFCMINVDLLGIEQRSHFISLIKKLSKKYGKKIKSCLLIIFSYKDDILHKIIQKIKNIQIFPTDIPDSSFLLDSQYKNKVTLIKSTNCGLGKSDSVRNGKGANKKVNYIYFPIGGKFSRNNLIDRLEELPDMTDKKKEFLIHLDINQTKELELLNEFIFKLIILRKFDLYEDVKFLGANVELIIEVPNDFKDYKTEIKILSYLKSEIIHEIDKINSSPELIIVSKILSIYRTDEILEGINLDKKISISQEKCQIIILQTFLNLVISNPNYYQYNIFIKFLSDAFSKFLKCKGLSHEILIGNGLSKEEALSLRRFIVESLINITKLFILSPYEDLIKSQEINKKLIGDDIEIERQINNSLKININSFSFDQIKPSVLVFNEDGMSVTIIATCSEEEKEFKNLEKLYNSQNIDLHGIRKKSSNNIERLKNFRKLNQNEILQNLINFLSLSGFTEEKIKDILGSYVYTPDNFIKVVLILMRIRVNIPVIMMGETGCGKTTLIEMASKLINKGKLYIKKMNIHAGINDEDIIKFMNKTDKEVENEDNQILTKKIKEFEKNPEPYLKNNTRENIFGQYKKEIQDRKIWVFFDEINTCNSMGLFKEIFSKHSIYGRPLDKRYSFIAACNPYRISDKVNNNFNILYKKNQKKRFLVYTVNPLPLSLLNFVFNFGSLKEADENNYIKNMIYRTFNKLFEKLDKKEKEKEKLINVGNECVKICHNYMKENNDISIVSLREVNRFNFFFEFFVNYITGRKNLSDTSNENKIVNSLSQIEIYYYSINLSLYICYYLRLPDKGTRKELENRINELKFFSEGNFLKAPLNEQDYICNNLEIPKGIAKNRNLKENLFILFFCIINKIPLIACGKPGRSKTLSFRILQNSMKGKMSKTKFCKQYPELITFKIQGSLNTTSEEITNVFKKGRLFQKDNSDKNVVICIDEMGLAEISENNPLKVLHSELETEENKISFVGISNWFIDASKMNRVIYNIVQDPDQEDIIETGKEIAKSYENNEDNFIEKYGDIIIRLSKAYYKFINKKKEENDKNQNFHGSRDYYSLIKSLMNDIVINKDKLDSKKKEEDEKIKLLNEICVSNIERNFGGLENSVNEFKSYFFDGYEENIDENKYNVMKCIEGNINDEKSRFLLLIVDSYLSQELLNYILEEINEKKLMNVENKEVEKKDLLTYNKDIIGDKKDNFKKYYIGSKFKKDKNNIIYSTEMLNKIKYQMEKDNILILKDLDSVYPALYELFNQSYENFQGKKFVYIGESKSLSFVNDKFKAIVLVEKNQIDEQEPPFLNRFEKHIFDFSILLNDEMHSLSEEIYNTLKEIINVKIKINDKDIDIQKEFEKYFIFVKEEEIKGLVYFGIKKLFYKINNSDKVEIDKNKIIEFVLGKIAPCFNEKIMLLISKYGFKNKFNFYYKCIYESFKSNYCYNIENYLEKVNCQTSIIYTFSSIVEEIISDKNENIKNNLCVFSKSSTSEVYINTISTMSQINKIFLDFLFNDETEKNLLILKFGEEDLNKLNVIYYLLNELRSNEIVNEKNYRQTKMVIFIIYLKKNSKNKNCISLLSNCPQMMISNLNNNYKNFQEILNSSNEEIFQKQLIDINSMINNNIDNILRYFDFNLNNYENTNKISYKDILLKSIINQPFVKDIIIKCLVTLIKNIDDDLVTKVFNEILLTKVESIENNYMYLFNRFINDIIFNNLRKIIIFLEKEQILNTASNNNRICQNEIIKYYINDYIPKIYSGENNKFIWKNKNLSQKISLPILINQKLPFSENIFNSLFAYIHDKISSKYLEEDSYFLKSKIKEANIYSEQEKYFKEIKKLDDDLKLELSKYTIITKILKSNNEELISNLFEDCFYIFFKNNNKLKSKYEDLSRVLNILIQLRLRTQKNNYLNIDLITKDKIKLYPSFMNLIKEEESNIQNNENITMENSTYLTRFISIIIFLQSYYKEIYMILELYYFLLKYVPSLFDNMKSIIENNKIKMKENESNPNYSKPIKIPFFYVTESLCKILKEKITFILNNINNNNALKDIFFNSIPYHVQNLLQIEKYFHMFSQEIFSMDIINKIIYKIQLKKEELTSFNQDIESLKLFFNKNNGETEKNEDKISIDTLKSQNICIIKIFGKNLDEYSYLMNKIMLNYCKLEKDDNFRYNLITQILLNDKLPNYHKLQEFAYPLIDLIFKFKSFELEEGIPKAKLKFKNWELSTKKNTNTNDIKEKINNGNSEQLNEIFLYRFEIVSEDYFKKILKENNANIYQKLCGESDLSMIHLQKSIDYFYNVENGIDKYLENIYKIYSISFIKRFLNYYTGILLDRNSYQQLSEREKINEILFKKTLKRVEIVKYYTLKLIYKKSNNNWETFKGYFKINGNRENDNDIFGFNKYFKLNLEESDSFLYMPILLLDKKNNENLEYNEILSKNNFDDNTKQIFDKQFLNDSYEYLYAFLSNILILYYCTNNIINREKKNNYKKLLSKINEHLNEDKIIPDKDILNFINIIFDEKNFKEKIIPKIGLTENNDETDIKKIFILLYSLRFVFSILINSKINMNNSDGFYFKLLTKDIKSNIKSSFIPGNFPNINLKVQSFEKIKELFKEGPIKKGIYLGSCGFSFTYDKVAFPNIEIKCPICKKYIGEKTKLFGKEELIRIFYDEKSRHIILNYSYSNKNIHSKLLKELEDESNNEKKKLSPGLKPLKQESDPEYLCKDLTYIQNFINTKEVSILNENSDKILFLKKEEKIRGMDNISYRVLNFILYSFLFYSNLQNYLSDKNLNEYVIQSMTCFEIMEENWKLIQEALGKIDIKLFLNIIFDEVIKELISCPNLKDKDQALNLENKINEIIINKMHDENSVDNYYKHNSRLISIKPEAIKTIIQEIYPPKKYSEKDYPDMKYFYLSELPSKENFISKFNKINTENYPLLNVIINEKEFKKKLQLLKYLPTMNKLCNYMINYVSFKYTREQAKQVSFEKEIKDEKIIDLLNKFKDDYKLIKPYIEESKIKENEELQYNLEDKPYLSDLCVDSCENNFGKVLLIIYKKMVELQNSFINKVIINSQSKNLEIYRNLFKLGTEINIQNCYEEQILNLPLFEDENEIIINNIKLMDIIINNSRRKNYEILYNYEEIEDELASLILPKIKLFKSDEFNKVIYQDEFFGGEGNNIIVNFIKKFQQRNLTPIEIKNVIKYINDNKKNNKFDELNFLFSLEVLIDIILDNTPDINVKLLNIIKDVTDSPNIELIKNFLNEMEKSIEEIEEDNNNNSSYFTVNCLINLIDIVELYCWDIIKKKLDKKYIENIDENIKSHFDNYYKKNNSEEISDFIINKIDLCTALRKFISRNLLGKNSDYLNPKDKIKNYLTNIELWPINFGEKEIIENEINKIFIENGNIDISQAFNLYKYLGGDLNKLKIIDILDNENDKEKEVDEEKDAPPPREIINIEDGDGKNEQKKDENKKEEEEKEEEKEEEEVDDDDEEDKESSNQELSFDE